MIFLSVTYAFINVTLTGTKQQIITAGDISLVLEEDENNLTIENALPMYDEVGMIQEDLFTFRLVNNGTANTNYIVKLVDVTNGNNKLSTNDVRYYLTKNGVGILESLSSLSDGVIDTGTIARDQTIHYTLRLWIRDGVTDNSSISGKSLSYRIDVEAEQLILDENGCEILPETEPNEPILASGMIPVIYDEEQESWVKADTTNTWYDYSNQMWANAVTVTEENRSTYMSSEAGTAISTDDINTMWVWIPRYSYAIKAPYGKSTQKCSELGEITADSPASCRRVEYPQELREEALNVCKMLDSSIETEEECLAFEQSQGESFTTFEEVIDYYISYGVIQEDTRKVIETYPNNIVSVSLALPGAIDIQFISKNQKDIGTGSYDECASNWVTPEGFTFGDEELSGLWVGKFETTGSMSAACADENCTTANLSIKPNLTSLRNQSVSSFFYASRSMQNTANAKKYGFDILGTGTMDVHMGKNTEWGIVAMLSQSKYGKYGNSSYSGADKEVAINNCSNYVTGIGGDSVSAEASTSTCTTNTYETEKGQAASTTGTIYGVYDMSGGSIEYVMGNYNNTTGSSGFISFPDSKYYDLYTSDTASIGYKAGDATYETSGWYSDRAYFVDSSYPWFYWSGLYYDGTSAGIFYRNTSTGQAHVYCGMRLFLKP